MIRFCKEEDVSRQHLETALARKPLCLDGHIWEEGRARFKYIRHDDRSLFLIPVVNKEGEAAGFAYQDNEANRELRMLKELRENQAALQFPDIFPQYEEVIIYGCNELAVSFADYLRNVKVPVSVIGKYWNCFGYQSDAYEIPTDAELELDTSRLSVGECVERILACLKERGYGV